MYTNYMYIPSVNEWATSTYHLLVSNSSCCGGYIICGRVFSIIETWEEHVPHPHPVNALPSVGTQFTTNLHIRYKSLLDFKTARR